MTWDYNAGVSGSVTIVEGRRVVGITAHATSAGSLTINGGDIIPIPAGTSISIVPNAHLVAPALLFTDTDSYFVEHIF